MRFSRKNLGIPYALFLLIFVVLPLFVLVFYAFTNGQGQFTFSNFAGFFTDPNTLGTLFYSLLLAAVTTAVCLLIAYPTAYILGTSRLKSRSVIVMLFVSFFTGLSSGAGIMISQYCGAGDRERTSQCVHTALALALGGGLLFTIVCILTAPAAVDLLLCADAVYS